MNWRVLSMARLLIVGVLLLAASSCTTQPEVAAESPKACPWPYGCGVRPEMVPEIPKIEGRAALPVDTPALGPPSGSKLGNEINGRKLPFVDQPAQGFSAMLNAGEPNTYWAMTDNGYGSQANSSDFLLRMYRIHANFEPGRGRSGRIWIDGWITLRDPDRHIPFPIKNENTEDRLLTGADFDPETVQRDPAGELWFGDEFGPFLLHTDATGRVLEAPFPLPGVNAPENPDLGSPKTANLLSSTGFEGMAISEDGRFLYPVLGGALADDPDQRRRFIYEFDLQRKRYTGEDWQYHTDDPKSTVTDLSPLVGDPQHRLLLIEHRRATEDSVQFAKVYLVRLDQVDASGFLVKHRIFGLPNIQLESILAIGDRRVVVLDDNDFPYTTKDTEALIIQLDDGYRGS